MKNKEDEMAFICRFEHFMYKKRRNKRKLLKAHESIMKRKYEKKKKTFFQPFLWPLHSKTEGGDLNTVPCASRLQRATFFQCSPWEVQ